MLLTHPKAVEVSRKPPDLAGGSRLAQPPLQKPQDSYKLVGHPPEDALEGILAKLRVAFHGLSAPKMKL